MQADTEQTILWRRLDTPGHDACRLLSLDDAWRLSGTALFRENDLPCCLSYEVECDRSWRSRSARVDGWIGRVAVSVEIRLRSDGRWSLDGVEHPELDGLVDIDLGFTPATNLVQLRRLSLAIGQDVEAPTAYLNFPELTLSRLEHRYHRVAAGRYDYAAPVFGYTGVLVVSDSGFVTEYPELWTMEAID